MKLSNKTSHCKLCMAKKLGHSDRNPPSKAALELNGVGPRSTMLMSAVEVWLLASLHEGSRAMCHAPQHDCYLRLHGHLPMSSLQSFTRYEDYLAKQHLTALSKRHTGIVMPVQPKGSVLCVCAACVLYMNRHLLSTFMYFAILVSYL